MPNQRILWLQHPLQAKTVSKRASIDSDIKIQKCTHMIFIREHQQPTRHTPGLQDVERSQTFRDWEAVVELAVDDELRRGPLGQEPRRVPFLVALAVLPERATEVVDGEEELLGRPLAQRAEDAVVADESLELAA